jgi:hypothetical protein
MKSTTFLLTFIFWILLHVANAETLRWSAFTCPNAAGHFSVSFPVGGEINGMNSQDFEDRFKDTKGMFSYWYIVSFEDSNVANTPKFIFKKEADSINQNFHPNKIIQKVKNYQGYPCCEYDYFFVDSPLSASRVIERLIAVGQRIYTIKFYKFAFARSEEEKSFNSLKAKGYPNAIKFLSSFKINK